MKRLIGAVCLFIITLSANAAEITFLENPTWNTVLEKAKKENKMIFLDAYATWCGPCKKMDAETYKNQEVADFFNANFINVKYDMEKGEGPMLGDRYAVQSFPNLLFINPDGVMVHKGIGFLESAEFMNLGKTAKNPATQYYTLKKNAVQLSNADFLSFVKQAEELEDQDVEQLTADYLAKQSDILGTPELIKIVMDHTGALPDEKSLAYVITSKAKILASKLYTAEDIDGRFVSLTLGYALSEKAQGESQEVNFEVVQGLLSKYVPERAFFVLNYFKIQYQLDNKQVDKALEVVDLLLTNYPSKVTLDQLCNAMMSVGPELLKEGKLDATLKKFEAIPIVAKDADQAYMKNFTKAVIYIKSKDTESFKKVAAELLANASTPQKVKDDLKAALETIK